jgi:hypothetical protein
MMIAMAMSMATVLCVFLAALSTPPTSAAAAAAFAPALPLLVSRQRSTGPQLSSPASLPINERLISGHKGIGVVFRSRNSSPSPKPSTTTTSLKLLLDVPDGFFTITFPVLGILLSLSKSFARVRMEENAWEQRLAEGRAKLMANDPTLTELDLRRMEAEREWSAYGAPRMQQEEQDRLEREERRRKRGGTQTVAAAERFPENSGNNSRKDGVMSIEEIEAFEATYGVEYDPYYDDPYAEDELPPGKFQTDKRYGDRIYDDGEIFYKTSDGLYYRQGAKPRSVQFW